MYHCHVHMFLIGQRNEVFTMIKEMPPLEHFTHEFTENSSLKEEQVPWADVFFVNLQGWDFAAGTRNGGLEALKLLLSRKKEEAQVILLAEKERIPDLAGMPEVTDIWVMPMEEGEIQFRILRWQQALKQSKDSWQTSQYLESAINSIPNLIWYKDKNGIHEKVNDSFCTTVNKTKQQVEGRGHAYIWDVEQDDPACVESENEVMRTRKTYVSEETIQTGEGLRLLTTYKSPLYDLDGSVMGTVGVAIDVTQERAYEQELIKKNQTLETIFTTIDCGVIRHTLDGTRLLSMNRAALEILGFSSEEEVIEKGFDYVASSVMKRDREKLRSSIQSLEKEGDSVSVEYRVRHEDGDIRHVMGNIKLLVENGELICQRFLLDCTAQKLQEKKRERRQMELVQALALDYTMVCYFDLETGLGFPLRFAEGVEHVFETSGDQQLSLKDSMEQYIKEYVYEEDQQLLLEASSQDKLKEELAENRLFYVNYRVMRNGKIKYFQMKVVCAGEWEEDHGIVLGFRSVDEETRKEMEQRGLLEDALMQANRASKAKSAFLSNMSHDIRTPMNAIVGFTTLAITHINRTEQVEEYLKKIMSSGNHLLSLINDVLDMSRIESGKMHLEEKVCSLPDILHELRNIVQADIHAKQLELFIDTVDVLDEDIYCDKLRLNQVLLNLLGNSVKYTGAGGSVSVRITEKPGAPKGFANYEFSIKDTGIGMSEEFVSHIFEPFEREKNTTTSGIQGTGLGMAITKNIVDMMNGTITVKSELGVGTEFILGLTLRLHKGPKEAQIIKELAGCRALVVDDDFNTCDSVSYMLGQIGLRAEWTLSGKEAVLRTRQAIMRNDSYGVYIIDWLLPDMNGIEVTRRIQKETGGNAPVIVLTAYDWADIEEEAKEAGVTAFCAKPLFLSELRTCLNTVIHTGGEREVIQKETKPMIRSGRILLAEDIELNQEIAVTILNEAGFETEVANNGREAVEMLKNSAPGYYNLILMDIQMPQVNGYEATRRIRKLEDPTLSSIPIIAMTANAFEEDKQEALSCGMNGHIAKPIDIGKLFATLDKVMC